MQSFQNGMSDPRTHLLAPGPFFELSLLLITETTKRESALFFPCAEDFCSCQQCLCVLRAEKRLNMEVTERLCVLCVRA